MDWFKETSLCLLTQKKALRESWLLDGVGGGGKEQEELKRQNQQDQRQIQALDQSILR